MVDAELKSKAEATRAASNHGYAKSGKIALLTPPPAVEGDVIDFVETSYRAEDEDFASAVASAKARRGLPIDNPAGASFRTLPAAAPEFKTVVLPKDDRDVVAVGVHAEVRAEAKAEKGITFLSAVIYHSNTQADLSAKDLKALRQVAKFAKDNDASISVVGHASSRTKDMKETSHKAANFDLSVARAEKVRDALVKNGVKGARVSIAAVSDTEKIVSESMPLLEAVNRRTEVYLSY
jgi:outer membrane protein OmpA-like peptidoglycan-associated protein